MAITVISCLKVFFLSIMAVSSLSYMGKNGTLYGWLCGIVIHEIYVHEMFLALTFSYIHHIHAFNKLGMNISG